MSISGGFKIDQMTREARAAAYSVDTSANGMPDGVIDSQDNAAIAAKLADPSLSGAARQMLSQLKTAATNPLAVPRTDATSREIGAAQSASVPWKLIEKLDEDALKGAKVDERIALVRHIVDGTGLGWFSRRVNNPKEQAILRILTSTPDHQRGELFSRIMSSGLSQKLISAIDGAEYEQYKIFARENIWGLEQPSDVARGMAELGISRDLAGTVSTIAALRRNRGEAFAEQVVSQLYAGGAMQGLLPFVYWTPMYPSCDSVSDIITEAAWRGQLEISRQQHKLELDRFLAQMPRSPNGDEGPTAKALRAEFQRRHDIARIMDGFSFAACAIEAAAAESRRARERYDYNNRPSYDYGGGYDSGRYGGSSSSSGLDDYVGGSSGGSSANGLDDYVR